MGGQRIWHALIVLSTRKVSIVGETWKTEIEFSWNFPSPVWKWTLRLILITPCSLSILFLLSSLPTISELRWVGWGAESDIRPWASLSPSLSFPTSLSLPLLAFLQQWPTAGGPAGIPDQCCLPGHWHSCQVYWCWGCHSWCGWFRGWYWNSVWQLDHWLCQVRSRVV